MTLEQFKQEFDDVRLKHIIGRSGKRNGKTIAVLWRGNNRYVGVAECGRKDRYSKAKGRLIALGRALKAFYSDADKVAVLTDHGNNINAWVAHAHTSILNNIPEHLMVIKKKEAEITA